MEISDTAGYFTLTGGWGVSREPGIENWTASNCPHTCADLHLEWETQRAGARHNVSNQGTFLCRIRENMHWIYKQLYQFTNNKLLWQRGNPSIDECYLYEPDLQPLIHAHSQPFQLLFKNNDSVKCLYVMVWLIPKVSIVTTTHTPLEILFGRCIIRPHACLLISDFFCTCYCRKIIISVSSIVQYSSY